MKRYLMLISLSILVVSCQTYSDDQLNQFDEEIQTYIEKNELKLNKSESGLYYEIVEQGAGKPIQFTDSVYFKYKGQLLDGTVFDEQLETPVKYPVRQLIGAWKEVLLEMNEGGKAFLISPPQLGYGTHKLDDIPESSILIFDLEVTDVK